MGSQAISAFLTYVVINAVTPGPGNIMALNTMGTYGWKKGKRLLLGIFSGYYVTQICCALFVFGLTHFLSPVISALTYVGAAYIVWLAVHIARSKPLITDTDQKPASFLTGFLLQCVNVKILLFGVTALTGYVVGYFTALYHLIFFSLVVATIGSVATIIWCIFGAVFRRYYRQFFRPVNIALSISLIWCAFHLIFN